MYEGIPALIDPASRTSDEWTALGRQFQADEHLGNDYEQAMFCFRQAELSGSAYAAEALRVLEQRCLGTDVVLEFDASELAILSSRPLLEPDGRRCPTCGALAVAPAAGSGDASVCSKDEGGCGARSYLSIEDASIRRGLAIQPYKENLEPAAYSHYGKCVHEVKYNSNLSDEEKRRILDDAAARIGECCVIERLLDGFSDEKLLVVPVPSSVKRKFQPVGHVARGIAAGRYEYREVLKKHSAVESKNRERGSELAEAEITCSAKLSGRPILLVDDTYGEGATMRACAKALKKAGAGDIFFLSLCRNTYGGIKG